MEFQYFERTLTLAFMLTSQNMSLGSYIMIKTLVTCASRICAPNKFSSEINIIKRFASWNDFPKSVINSIINKTLNTPSNNESLNINYTENSNEITIHFRFPYYGDKKNFILQILHS